MVTSDRPRRRAGATGLRGIPSGPARSHRDSVRPRAAAPGGADRWRQESQLSASRDDPVRHDPGRVAARGPDGGSGPGARRPGRAGDLSRLHARGAGDAAPHGADGATGVRARLRGAGATCLPRLPRTDPRDRLPLVAVDEAHCISEWGHDFRPEYLTIGALLADLPRARVLACTATATPIVRDEILARLGLPPDTPQIVRGFARPNLALRAAEIVGRRERERLVDGALSEALEGPKRGRGTAIVYAPTRKQADEESERLAERGWRTRSYHAGLDGKTRDAVQRDFADGRLEVVVATNAFGMGIDRPDVRAVIHLGPPGSIEAYYQEVGRAGRDGAPAWGLLLVSPGDMPRRRHLLESDAPGEAVLAHKWGLFLELMRWAEGGSCRHDAILRYFGDEAETLDGCGHCDVCAALEENTDATGEAVTL